MLELLQILGDLISLSVAGIGEKRSLDVHNACQDNEWMHRYVVRNRKTGATEHLYDTLGEAIGKAIKLIDEGGDADIIDSQGSGTIEVNRLVLSEAEGYLMRSLGSETFDRPQPLEDILEAARKQRKDQPTIYHWDTGSSDIR